MSPEQAEGKKVDARSDIFSFGAVLYEMLTGRPSFRQSRRRDRRCDPPRRSATLSELLPGLQRILVHCLQKDPNRRYHAMADVRIALEDLKDESSALAAAPSRRIKHWIIDAALLLVAVAAGAVWLLYRPTAVHPPIHVTQVTFDGRLAMNPSISADAKYVAYASDRAGQGNLDIWVQALPGGDPVRLTRDGANDDYPAFSPTAPRSHTGRSATEEESMSSPSSAGRRDYLSRTGQGLYIRPTANTCCTHHSLGRISLRY